MLMYESASISVFSNMSAFILSLSVLIIMHESSLLTYLHIPSVFHNQRPCNGYHELYSGRNIVLPWKTIAQQDHKLSLGSAHVKYGVSPRPNLQISFSKGRKIKMTVFQGRKWTWVITAWKIRCTANDKLQKRGQFF